MLFSKLNFIVPINAGDQTLKIKNIAGVIVYIIKEPTCTIKQNAKFLSIKQSAESTLINLEFSSNTEATEAHSLLRDAVDILLDNQTPSPPMPSYIVSKDYKYENPTAATTFNAEQIQGISAIQDNVAGGTMISIEVNGISVLIGDGCNAITFSAPTYHILLAKKFSISSFTTNSITISSPTNDFVAGDSIILIDGGVPVYREVSSVSGNIVILTSPVTGPITFVARPKKWSQIAKGDIPLWFGSFATYELDTTDTIAYKYITEVN